MRTKTDVSKGKPSAGEEWPLSIRLALTLQVDVDRDQWLSNGERDAEFCCMRIEGEIFEDSQDYGVLIGDLEAQLFDLHESDHGFVTLDSEGDDQARLHYHLFAAAGI